MNALIKYTDKQANLSLLRTQTLFWYNACYFGILNVLFLQTVTLRLYNYYTCIIIINNRHLSMPI